MLLDTHVLIWALMEPAKLSKSARGALETSTQRAVSAASLYEITLKARLGKWPEVEELLNRDIDADLRKAGFDVLSATGPVMEAAGSFDWQHRDPFDRLIVATAMANDLPVISKDKTLDTCPWEDFKRVW